MALEASEGPLDWPLAAQVQQVPPACSSPSCPGKLTNPVVGRKAKQRAQNDNQRKFS